MSEVEQLEQVLTPDQAERNLSFNPSPAVEVATVTQQLLDELLGRFEEDDSPVFSAYSLNPELSADSDA
jgi:hypothetical protein